MPHEFGMLVVNMWKCWVLDSDISEKVTTGQTQHKRMGCQKLLQEELSVWKMFLPTGVLKFQRKLLSNEHEKNNSVTDQELDEIHWQNSSQHFTNKIL